MIVGNILKLSNNKIEWEQDGHEYYIGAERNTDRDGCTVSIIRSDGYFTECNNVPEWMPISDVVDVAFKSESLFYKELAKL